MVWRVPSREIGAQVRLGSSLGPRRLSGSYSIPDDSGKHEYNTIIKQNITTIYYINIVLL